MNNNDKYKNAFSGVHHSEDLVERIMDMTYDKKQTKGLMFKRIASVVVAFAILIGGGFGINSMTNKDKPLGVMVTYAGEFMKIKSANKQTIVRGVYFAPIDDKEKCAEQKAKAEKDYKEIVDEVEKLMKHNESGGWEGVGNFDLYQYDDEGNSTLVAKLYTSGAGFFATDKTDYKNVKSFTVENESKDGFLDFEWLGTEQEFLSEPETDEIDTENPYPHIGHKFTLTGDELRESQEKYDNKYGYFCRWEPRQAAIDENFPDKNFTASMIKDKITFTFEYDDGTIESASVNITFDDYGHMQISE